MQHDHQLSVTVHTSFKVLKEMRSNPRVCWIKLKYSYKCISITNPSTCKFLRAMNVLSENNRSQIIFHRSFFFWSQVRDDK